MWGINLFDGNLRNFHFKVTTFLLIWHDHHIITDSFQNLEVKIINSNLRKKIIHKKIKALQRYNSIKSCTEEMNLPS